MNPDPLNRTMQNDPAQTDSGTGTLETDKNASTDNPKVNPGAISTPFRPLESEWDYDGFHHRVSQRVGMAVLVEKTRLKERPGWMSWEVGVLIIAPASKLPNGSVVPRREAYPSSSHWGARGWTYTTRADAELRLASLESK